MNGQPVDGPTGQDTYYTYDGYDSLVRIQVGGRSTEYNYDAANRLVSTQMGESWQVPDSIVTSQRWDRAGNVVSTTDGNGNITYHYYDRLHRLIGTINAENYLTVYEYDAFGNVVRDRLYMNREDTICLRGAAESAR